VSETLGGLVDRLVVLNIKTWFAQEALYEAANAGRGLTPEETARLATLNLERNKAMTAIDQCLAAAVESGTAEINPRIKIVKGD
jgi:hypothetical protein